PSLAPCAPPPTSPLSLHDALPIYKTHAACWFYHQAAGRGVGGEATHGGAGFYFHLAPKDCALGGGIWMPPRPAVVQIREALAKEDRKSTRLNSSHVSTSYAVFCLK